MFLFELCCLDTVDHIAASGGGCVEAGGILPRPPPPLQQPHQPCGEVLHPKRQAVVDRLRRRIESYRRRQTECIPRFDQSFSGVCEQQNLETTALQRRFLEGKSKRTVKKGADRQQQLRQQETPQQQSLQLQNQLQGQLHPHGLTSNLHSSVHVQQKFLKRPAESGTGIGSGSVLNIGSGQCSPPGKLQRVNVNGPQENLTKFSVEIVQQLEFTSAADSQPQQISTNVTVKALTNTSVKSEIGTPLLECKREPDNDFADLDQCAAALEKDNFPGFTDLIGEEAGDEIMSDAFKELISEISEYPEFMKEFDFEDKGSDNMCSDDRNNIANDSRIVKVEEGTQGIVKRSDSPNGITNRGFGPRPGAGGGYGGELSPAAQTLKQMAEQHQHKQMGLGARSARSPYGELQDYLSGPGGTFRKQEQVKQEPTFPPSYKQYSPYGSPSPGSGSPGYLPRGPMGGPSPPRPPSGPPPQNNNSLHINQAQHLHISHPSHGIQVSGGQHMQLSGDLGQGNVSVAAHQGMFFGQQPGGNSPHQHQQHPTSGSGPGPGNNDTYTVSQSQTINFTQQTLRQRQQQAHQQATSPITPGGSPGNGNMGNVPTSVNGNVPNIGSMGGVNNPNMGMGGIAMAREHHAKLLQQQQQHMLRAQLQQMGGQLRPPPPDYKATQGPLGPSLAQQQARFTQNNIRRAINQPIPPSGPMMRGGMMYGGGRYVGGPGQGIPGGAGVPDWRHQLLIQQQQGQFVRHSNMQGFPHQQNQVPGGGFPVNNGGIQQQQQHLHQQQLLRSQQQQQMLSGQQQQQQQHPHQHQLPPHILAHQNQSLSMQGQMQNIHMNQSQSISIGMGNVNGSGGANPNGQQQQNGPVPVTNFQSLQNNNANVTSSFPGQPADFNLDFLENMPSGDSSNFTAQELLNSLDSDPGFNLQDIL